MRVDSRAYGFLEVDARQKIKFPQGLYGFEGLSEYVLLDARQRPFYWLQSLSVKETAFVLIDPLIVRSDYNADIDPQDYEALKLTGPEDERFLQFAIVTIPADTRVITANLQGPLIINKEIREGRQCISRSNVWHVRHNIVEEMKSNENRAC